MSKSIFFGKVVYTKKVRVKDEYVDFSETFKSMWTEGTDLFRLYPSREIVDKRHIKILESKIIGQTSIKKNE